MLSDNEKEDIMRLLALSPSRRERQFENYIAHIDNKNKLADIFSFMESAVLVSENRSLVTAEEMLTHHSLKNKKDAKKASPEEKAMLVELEKDIRNKSELEKEIKLQQSFYSSNQLNWIKENASSYAETFNKRPDESIKVIPTNNKPIHTFDDVAALRKEKYDNAMAIFKVVEDKLSPLTNKKVRGLKSYIANYKELVKKDLDMKPVTEIQGELHRLIESVANDLNRKRSGGFLKLFNMNKEDILAKKTLQELLSPEGLSPQRDVKKQVR